MPWLTIAHQDRRIILGEDWTHDCVSFGRRSGRAERVVCGGLEMGSPAASRPPPTARVVAALSSRCAVRPAPAARRIVLPRPWW